jgi:ABC-type branched-subunit amino acid transport system substrate-binding protein
VESVTGLSRLGLLFLGAALILGVVASTVATFRSAQRVPGCPDVDFGCARFEPGEAVVLGVLSSRTDVRRAVRLVAELRDHLSGRRLRVLAWDDRCTPEGAAEGARQLATDSPDGPPVVAVVGETCPPAITPAAQILSDSGITLASASPARLPMAAGRPRYFLNLGPVAPGPLQAFDAAYAQRYGPPSSVAIHAAFAADAMLRASESLARRDADGRLLIPRTSLRDALLDSGFVPGA